MYKPSIERIVGPQSEYFWAMLDDLEKFYPLWMSTLIPTWKDERKAMEAEQIVLQVLLRKLTRDNYLSRQVSIEAELDLKGALADRIKAIDITKARRQGMRFKARTNRVMPRAMALLAGLWEVSPRRDGSEFVPFVREIYRQLETTPPAHRTITIFQAERVTEKATGKKYSSEWNLGAPPG